MIDLSQLIADGLPARVVPLLSGTGTLTRLNERSWYRAIVIGGGAGGAIGLSNEGGVAGGSGAEVSGFFPAPASIEYEIGEGGIGGTVAGLNRGSDGSQSRFGELVAPGGRAALSHTGRVGGAGGVAPPGGSGINGGAGGNGVASEQGERGGAPGLASGTGQALPGANNAGKGGAGGGSTRHGRGGAGGVGSPTSGANAGAGQLGDGPGAGGGGGGGQVGGGQVGPGANGVRGRIYVMEYIL
jgi:hypothetical protein